MNRGGVKKIPHHLLQAYLDCKATDIARRHERIKKDKQNPNVGAQYDVERMRDAFPFFADIDAKGAKGWSKTRYIRCARLIQQRIRTFYPGVPQDQFNAVVLTTPHTPAVSSTGCRCIKSGMHVHLPNIIVTADRARQIIQSCMYYWQEGEEEEAAAASAAASAGGGGDGVAPPLTDAAAYPSPFDTSVYKSVITEDGADSGGSTIRGVYQSKASPCARCNLTAEELASVSEGCTRKPTRNELKRAQKDKRACCRHCRGQGEGASGCLHDGREYAPECCLDGDGTNNSKSLEQITSRPDATFESRRAAIREAIRRTTTHVPPGTKPTEGFRPPPGSPAYVPLLAARGRGGQAGGGVRGFDDDVAGQKRHRRLKVAVTDPETIVEIEKVIQNTIRFNGMYKDTGIATCKRAGTLKKPTILVTVRPETPGSNSCANKPTPEDPTAQWGDHHANTVFFLITWNGAKAPASIAQHCFSHNEGRRGPCSKFKGKPWEIGADVAMKLFPEQHHSKVAQTSKLDDFVGRLVGPRENIGKIRDQLRDSLFSKKRRCPSDPVGGARRLLDISRPRGQGDKGNKGNKGYKGNKGNKKNRACH